MTLLVTGSIGIDTVESPFGSVKDVLGGSSIYFACAASFFSPVRLVGVVGEDCPAEFLGPLRGNPRIDLAGLEVRKGSKTFRWHGRYQKDINLRDTIAVELNVLAERGPTIPEAFRDSRFVFLANTHPALQLAMLEQLRGPELVVADTMDLWIDSESEALKELLSRLDGFVLNDSEARQLTGQTNVVLAGEAICEMMRASGGRSAKRDPLVIIKKGEHGSVLFAGGSILPLPGYPARKVVDPTGAGDSFAGAFMGYIASVGKADERTLRRAMGYGSVTASLALEDFSLGRLLTADRQTIDNRLSEFEAMLRV
jgi:sugar/nucleoside kinase (ribokinase family)